VTVALTAEQRRFVAGVCLIVGGFVMVTASYNYILNPMLEGLNASEGQTSLLRQLPSIAALLVVFLGGVLGDRYGDRKVLRIASVLFLVGCALVAFAPVFAVASLGLVMESIAASAGGVIALGLLGAKISDPQQRASAFSVFAIVSPLIYMAMPILAGVLVGELSWRFVAGIWALWGLVMLWSSGRLLPVDGSVRGGGEMVTPVVAGVVLASGVQAVNMATSTGLTSTDTLIRAGICLLGLLALVILFRRPGKRSLSLDALRRGGMIILLAVVLLVPLANIWYYATVGYQYVYGLNVLQTALMMIPAQAAGVAGAIATRKVLQKKGVRFTGTVGLILFAFGLLTVLTVQETSPLWVPAVAFSIYAMMLTATSIPITNAIMNTAARGEEGSASAFRSAASHLGNALGVVFTTSILVTVTTFSATGSLTADDLASQQTLEVVDGIIDGATSEELSSQYSVPVDEVDAIDDDLAEAMIDGLHAVVVGGALISLLCAAGFNAALRRQVRARETAAHM